MVVKYNGLPKFALPNFHACHGRVRIGKVKEIFWPKTKEGYQAFLAEIGEIPEGMLQPTVGRKDHSKGYVPGNIQWEEKRFNSMKRRGTIYEKEQRPEFEKIEKSLKFKKGTKEHLEHQSQASLLRWEKPGEREKMSALSSLRKGEKRKPFSEEQKQKLRGRVPWNKDKKGHSLPDEQKEKMKISQKARRAREKELKEGNK